MDPAEEWPDFDEVMHAVGAPESAVRKAMRELHVAEHRLIRDGRLIRYDPKDIDRIRSRLLEQRGRLP